MEFLPEEIQEYADFYTKPDSDLLDELFRYTQTNVLQPRMISSKNQGRFLSMLSKIHSPKFILEIGTYTGYSALCMAEGLQTDGKLHTIDINDELREVQENYIQKSSYKDLIVLHTGNALEVIPQLEAPHWDFVFIDADKENYSAYYDLVFQKMRKGGLILADNVLWSGKVTRETDRENDKDTAALHAFNQMVLADKRVDNILLPFRDGIMLAMVK